MIRFLLAGLLFFAATPAHADDGVTILQHATVIDATSPVARDGMSVVIADGHIVRLDHDEQINMADYPDANIVDLTGRYVLPGLVETHIHLATSPDLDRAESALARLLRGGVTTVRDMAGDARFLANLRRRVLIGELAGPEIQYSAIMAGPSFFDDPRTAAASQGENPGDVAWLQAIDEDTDMTIAVAQARGTGARGIKIYANLPAEIVARVGAEARAQDMRLWSHGTIAPALPLDAVEAGVNVVSHACMLVSHISPLHPQAYPARPDADFTVFGDDYAGYADLFAAMRQHGTMLDANLRLYALADARRAATPDDPPLIRCPLDYAAGIVAAAHVAGIPITTGTDGIAPPEAALPSIHEELTLLHTAAGLSPHEVITAATFNGALALGMRTEIGLVLPGYQADLLVLTNNPLEDIGHMSAIDQVMVDGQYAFRADPENGDGH
jgi:imidazolonepropionase-like amidohydrolase